VTAIKPNTTKMSNSLLKLSGSKSNPFDGESRVKYTSGPPNAIINDCDSKFVLVLEIDVIPSTSLLYETIFRGRSGTRGLYLCESRQEYVIW